ncbi:mitochondrial ribosomal protein L49 [Osmerus eperlanus]|uniref:Large ribosomal subunit protein mL49 n=1 Tax=Osmerus mordax TaxID=8014 RepID=C1BM57_OSMMO|nr:Mitochondrial 39S ribosomal protein L49 [Osmerus mordax]
MSLSFNHRVSMLCRAARASLQLYSHQPKTTRNVSQLRTVCSSVGEQKHKVEESAAEYKFVERLIPPSRVPAPPKRDGPAPSGWTPPAEVVPALPYMIRRSRMHNIPVYTDITHGSRRTTLLRKVEGDIWALEKDVKEYLKEVTGKDLPTQVNEVTMTVRVKGHFDQELKEWLLKKGF